MSNEPAASDPGQGPFRYRALNVLANDADDTINRRRVFTLFDIQCIAMVLAPQLTGHGEHSTFLTAVFVVIALVAGGACWWLAFKAVRRLFRLMLTKGWLLKPGAHGKNMAPEKVFDNRMSVGAPGAIRNLRDAYAVVPLLAAPVILVMILLHKIFVLAG